MSVFGLLVALIVIGLVFYVVSLLPLPPFVRNIINVALGVVVAIWLVTIVFRLFPSLNFQLSAPR